MADLSQQSASEIEEIVHKVKFETDKTKEYVTNGKQIAEETIRSASSVQEKVRTMKSDANESRALSELSNEMIQNINHNIGQVNRKLSSLQGTSQLSLNELNELFDSVKKLDRSIHTISVEFNELEEQIAQLKEGV